MIVSVFFAKIFGTLAIIKGLAIAFRRKEIEGIVSDLIDNKAVLMLVAGAELFFGLVVVSLHNFWFTGFAIIVTIMGWLMVIEGIFIAFAPHHITKKIFQHFNKPIWYKLGIIVALFIGVYLIYSSSFSGFYAGFHKW